jgi:hypothetical protein
MSTVRIQVRRGVAADWTSVNPILAAGEMGYESDTNKFKFGNGTGAWSTLSYGASDTPGVTEIAQDAINSALVVGTGLTKTYNDGANTITVAISDSVWANKTYVDQAVSGLQNTSDQTYILQDDRGTAGGVAALDNSGKVPADQLPNGTIRNLIGVSGDAISYNQSTGTISLDFSSAPYAIANKNYVTDQISNIVNNAPGALDTLLELSNALGSDANFATTMTNSLATKAPIASPTFTGTVTIPAGAMISGYDTIATRETAITNALVLAANDATDKADAAEAAAIAAAAADAAAIYLPSNGVTELITDTAAGMISVGSGNGLTRLYNDATNSLTINVDQSVIATVAAVGTAKQEAIDAAGTDATTKAQDAITTAASDATTKANNAKSEAITAAGTAADTKVSTHNSATTNIHGISDTSLLALKSEVAAVTKTTIGLGNVDNTADASKPVSSAQATAIATAKSEAIADATSRVTAVIGGAAAAFDTLGELATALGNDANFASTVTTSLAGKVPSATPISQKTASYTLASVNEKDSMIEMNAAGATTVTVPTNAAVPFAIGTSLDILRVGAGAVDVAAAGGVTINATPGLKLRAQWSSATLIKRATDTWVLVGDLSA